MSTQVDATTVDFHMTDWVYRGVWGYRLIVDRTGDVGVNISLTPAEAVALFRLMRSAIGFKFPKEAE